MADELKVALVQTTLHWQDPAANRSHFTRILASLNGRADLVILPEMFSTGFSMDPHKIQEDEQSKTIAWMQEQSSQLKFALTGSIIARDQNKYFNRLYFVSPKGGIRTYNKRHTFTLAGEDKVYERGTDRVIITYKGFKICPMICYDLRFPVWSRNTENFDVLLYVANWPSGRINAWDSLLRARAIENLVYSIGVNRIGSDENGLQYAGHSAVYDSLGETLVFSKNEEILFAALRKDHLANTREKLKFLQDRDNFNLLM